MTLQSISKAQMEYILSHSPSNEVNVIVTNKQHPKKKNRYLQMDTKAIQLLKDCQEEEKSCIIEKHGWFEEPDKYGKIKMVYYDYIKGDKE